MLASPDVTAHPALSRQDGGSSGSPADGQREPFFPEATADTSYLIVQTGVEAHPRAHACGRWWDTLTGCPQVESPSDG